MTPEDLTRIEKEALLYREHDSKLDTFYIRNEDIEEVLDCIEQAYIAGSTAEQKRLSEFNEFMWGISVFYRTGNLNCSEAVRGIIEKWDEITATK